QILSFPTRRSSDLVLPKRPATSSESLLTSSRALHAIGRILLYVVTITVAILFCLPFFWTVSSSLKPTAELYLFPPTFLPQEIRWQNYADVFRLAPFVRFILNTIFVTAIAMVGQILSASAVAFGFTRFRFPGRNLLFIVVLST